jgi:hypothetical protein
MSRQIKDLQSEWRKELLGLVDLFLDYKIPNHERFTEWTPEERKQQEFRNKLYGTINRFFDNAVRECAIRIAGNNQRREKLDMDYLSVTDFLYWNPPLGGMPDSSLRVGVDFEVGGAYEDWGFVVEQRKFNGDKKTYDYRTVATGRGLVEALLNARKALKDEFDKKQVEKCVCGNEMVGYKEEKDGTRIPQCKEHFLK